MHTLARLAPLSHTTSKLLMVYALYTRMEFRSHDYYTIDVCRLLGFPRALESLYCRAFAARN
jgi:hypothetical protein